MQMKLTILAYYLYEKTNDPWSLGMLGLCEAIPRVGMALPAGYLVERMDKQRALWYIVLGYGILSIALYGAVSLVEDRHTLPMILYLLVFLIGMIGSMGGAASVTMFSLIIDRTQTAKLSALNSNSWMLGATIGPILAGILMHQVGPVHAVLGVVAAMFIGIIAVSQLPSRPAEYQGPVNWSESILQIREGIRYVIENKTMLWGISLDLFAVLFGGCIALLPIYAKDILHTDTQGYGILRAAMTIGAFVSMLVLAQYPLRRHTGRWLLFAVFCFGCCNIGFGISTHFWLSFVFLFLAGAFDAISVVVRGALLILETPDHMRARVASVNSMFISSSNELGAFESGAAAKLMGTVPSVVFGGCMTLLFACLAFWKSDALKNYHFVDKE